MQRMSNILGATRWEHALVVLGALLLSSMAPGQPTPSSSVIEEIVVVGSRGAGRSVLDSPVPVDTLSNDELLLSGATETGRALQLTAPSFNFSSSSISDGTDALRPATLRGLGPDQVLVLVNGKRRHNSALIHVNTSVGRGTAGVDLNAIPFSALESVEVLRDGAAAQYGSDAIAGVINLRLKREVPQEIQISYGETSEGDGGVVQTALNGSLGFPDGGFLFAAYEYRDRESTNRAGLSGAVNYPLIDGEGDGEIAADNAGCSKDSNVDCDPREAGFDRLNFRIGDADSEQHSLVLNGEYPIAMGTLYFFSTFSDRENQSAGFYRSAGDANRNVLAVYPHGFLPLINTEIQDQSLALGLETMLGNWELDASFNWGLNSFDFFISNSLNASFGAESPTSADAGGLEYGAWTGQLDAYQSWENYNFAWGMEVREENYVIEAGEEVSYEYYRGADNEPTKAPGIQVFPGFQPRFEVDEDRSSYAFYGELNYQPQERLDWTGALRFEDYQDFGSTMIGKASLLFRASEICSLRGSVNSGLRAPSLHQSYFNNISTQFVTTDTDEVVPEDRGTFRTDSALAKSLGIPQLDEESSLNYSLGIIITPADNISLTADYYLIDIEDRIALSGAIEKDEVPAVAEEFGDQVQSAQFFLNLGDTRTRGLDLVLSWRPAAVTQGSLELRLAANYTDTEIDSVNSAPGLLGGLSEAQLFTPQDQSIIEEWQPDRRVSLVADYRINERWQLTGVVQDIGKYTVTEANLTKQTFSAKQLVDFQLSYEPLAGLRIIFGGNNIFDEYPDKNRIGQSRGGTIQDIVSSPGVFQYSRRSAPFGFNGAYYYTRFHYTFS